MANKFIGLRLCAWNYVLDSWLVLWVCLIDTASATCKIKSTMHLNHWVLYSKQEPDHIHTCNATWCHLSCHLYLLMLWNNGLVLLGWSTTGLMVWCFNTHSNIVHFPRKQMTKGSLWCKYCQACRYIYENYECMLMFVCVCVCWGGCICVCVWVAITF